MTQPDLLALLAKYHLKPTKSLGQHYLIDETILAKIIETADLTQGELVLEVGAGPGILTKALAEAGAEVLAVEYDRNFTRLLQEEFHNWRNIHVLGDDALRLNLAELKKDDQPYRKIVANIPYQITNPLVRKLLAPTSPIDVAVLLIQKEVAERLAAPPGSSQRGLVTVMIEYYGTIQQIVAVPPASFWPAPAVDSVVVRIDRTNRQAQAESTDLKADQGLFWFVAQGFSGKRKILINSLSASLRLPKSSVAAIVKETTIDPMARAEDLTVQEWIDLFGRYQQFVVKDQTDSQVSNKGE